MTATDSKSENIQARVYSKDRDSIPLDEVVLSIPINLNSNGLSEIVIHLLGSENNTEILFAFLIHGELLTTDISTFLDKKTWSSENILDIQVIKASSFPKQKAVLPHPDWITSLTIVPEQYCKFSNAPLLWTGQCNGSLALWKGTEKIESLSFNSSLPLRQLALSSDNSVLYAAQGYKVTAFKISNTKILQTPIQILDNSGTIECLSIIPLGEQEEILITGSYDRHITLWKSKLGKKTSNYTNDHGNDSIIKISSLNESSSTMIHTGPIQCISYDQSKNLLYSGSWDHSIRTWSIENTFSISPNLVYASPSAVLCIDPSKDSIIVSGHSDHHIRIWDERTNGSSPIRQLSGHHGFVTRVLKANDFNLYSVSLDGNLLVWDLRATTGPIQRICPKDKNKMFCMEMSLDSIYVGDESGNVNVFQHL